MDKTTIIIDGVKRDFILPQDSEETKSEYIAKMLVIKNQDMKKLFDMNLEELREQYYKLIHKF